MVEALVPAAIGVDRRDEEPLGRRVESPRGRGAVDVAAVDLELDRVEHEFVGRGSTIEVDA